MWRITVVWIILNKHANLIEQLYFSYYMILLKKLFKWFIAVVEMVTTLNALLYQNLNFWDMSPCVIVRHKARFVVEGLYERNGVLRVSTDLLSTDARVAQPVRLTLAWPLLTLEESCDHTATTMDML